ncbi:MAG: hypothetical protein HZC42_04320 [Candidatus Eisenbacteria bacterium]|nr:hypothetical protein [Candidatus Eisenbacteria bacterium]
MMRSLSFVLCLLAPGFAPPAHAQALGAAGSSAAAAVAADSIAAATPPAAAPATPAGQTPAPEPSAPLAAPFASSLPGAGASITNPAISVIGWFQGAAGGDRTAQASAFELREAELGFQAAVDPFTRADFFLSAGPAGLEVEEGFITWLALPAGGQSRVGRFRADLGKFNRTHPPETPFADRPLATVAFYGEEGLTTDGVALSTLVPNPLDLYWDVVANVGTIPGAGESPVFLADTRSDLLALGRTSVFVPLRQSADLNLGASYANARADSALRAGGPRAQLATLDLTFHWKNPRRSIYRSLFAQVEWTAEQGSRSGAARTGGGFAFAIWQFARQWKLGARWDRTASPGDRASTSGALVLVQYQPSEFSTLSVQGRRVRAPAVPSTGAYPDGRDRDAVFFKWTFNIGPHGAHSY